MPPAERPIGTLRQRRNGRWQSQARLPATGKLTAKTWRTTSKAEARKLHAQWIADVIGGREGAAGPTLEAHIDAWLLRQAHRPPATLKAMRVASKRITGRVGRLRLRDITPRVCDDLLAELAATYAAQTVSASRSVLSQSLQWAVVRGDLARNPLTGVRVTTRPAKPRETATLEQVEQILAAEGDQMWRTFWLTLAGTGARQGEVCALQWGDIDWDGQSIRVERTMTLGPSGRIHVGEHTKNLLGVRSVPVRPAVLEALRAWRLTMSEAVGLPAVKAQAPVFVGPKTGRNINANSVLARWRKTLQAADIEAPITPHSIRHWAASSMLRAGMDPHIVAKSLGHSIGVLMETYGHHIPADARRRALEGLPDVGVKQ